jgi:hypothetical protein
MVFSIVRKSDLVAAKQDLADRCELMLYCGMSYKAISAELGLTRGEIYTTRKRCGVSAWEYRNARGPLGKAVSARVKLTPIESVGNLVKLFSAKTPKRLT